MTEFAQLQTSDIHDAAGNRKSKPLVSTRLRQDEGIHSNYLAVYVHQRSARITWIDRRVRLYVDHRRIRISLPGHRGNNAVCHRIAQTFRTAKCKHRFALPEVPVISQL